MFKIEFETANEAFNDGLGDLEIARILSHLKNNILNGITEGGVYDMNGNKVGTYEWEKS